MTDGLAAFLAAQAPLVERLRNTPDVLPDTVQAKIDVAAADALDALVGMVRAVLALSPPIDATPSAAWQVGYGAALDDARTAALSAIYGITP